MMLNFKTCILLRLYLVSNNVIHFLYYYVLTHVLRMNILAQVYCNNFYGYVFKFNFLEVIIDYLYTIVKKNSAYFRKMSPIPFLLFYFYYFNLRGQLTIVDPYFNI